MEARRYPFHAMGCPCEIQLYPGAGFDVDATAEAGIAEVARLEAKYSRFRDGSLTSAINRSAGDAGGIQVDPETASLLDYAQTAYEQSDGLFDITSGILRRAWDFKSDRLPDRDVIDALRGRVGWGRVDWKHPRVRLPEVGMELDFGGYVKEYAADRVAELCRKRGACHGIVDLGGDLSIVGPHPDGEPWWIGIRDAHQPERAIANIPVLRGALATSGDYERFMIVDGKRYGHILSPATGWPVESFASVSVVAGHCLVAGSASTIAMLRGREDGAAWLDGLGLPHLRQTWNGALEGTLQPQVAAAVGRGDPPV